MTAATASPRVQVPLGRALLVLALLLAAFAAPGLRPASASPGEISYVAAASTAGSRSSHTVRLPTQVEPGDLVVTLRPAPTEAS